MFLGLPGNKGTEKVIVLDTRIAALAFLVDRVIRIASVDQTDIREGADEAFAAGQLNLPDGAAILLDAVALVERASETING
jgi:chemotaxis signal transduction protein